MSIKALAYQPMSGRLLNSSVILGIAVATIVRSSDTRKMASRMDVTTMIRSFVPGYSKVDSDGAADFCLESSLSPPLDTPSLVRGLGSELDSSDVLLSVLSWISAGFSIEGSRGAFKASGWRATAGAYSLSPAMDAIQVGLMVICPTAILETVAHDPGMATDCLL